MKCPCCGAAELIHDTRDMPYTYKGQTNTIPAVTGDFCPACGEVVLNREHGDRLPSCSAVVSMPSRAMRTAKPSRPLLWSSCSSCLIATQSYLERSELLDLLAGRRLQEFSAGQILNVL